MTEGRSLIDIQAEMKKQSELIKSKIGKPGGDFIKVQQDKKFKLPDGTTSEGPLSVVILDFISVNTFYDRPYKEGEMVPPACFAINEEPELLAPHATSPVMQVEKGKICKQCPNDVFGSAGNGKACTNTRVLAVVPAGSGKDEPVLNLKVSPTAIRAFDAYVKTISEQFDGPPIVVVTDIYFDPGLKYPSLRFGNPSPNEQLAVHFERQKAAKERLAAPIDVSQYSPPPAAKAAAATGKRR
jgi:hypothetical protein